MMNSKLRNSPRAENISFSNSAAVFCYRFDSHHNNKGLMLKKFEKKNRVDADDSIDIPSLFYQIDNLISITRNSLLLIRYLDFSEKITYQIPQEYRCNFYDHRP